MARVYGVIESLAVIATHEPLQIGKIVTVKEKAGIGGFSYEKHTITAKDIQRVASRFAKYTGQSQYSLPYYSKTGVLKTYRISKKRNPTAKTTRRKRTKKAKATIRRFLSASKAPRKRNPKRASGGGWIELPAGARAVRVHDGKIQVKL